MQKNLYIYIHENKDESSYYHLYHILSLHHPETSVSSKKTLIYYEFYLVVIEFLAFCQ